MSFTSSRSIPKKHKMKVRITHIETNPSDGKSEKTRTREYTIGEYDELKDQTIVTILPEGTILRRGDQNFIFHEWSSRKHAEETIRSYFENTATKDSNTLLLWKDWEKTSGLIKEYTGSGVVSMADNIRYFKPDPFSIYHDSTAKAWGLSQPTPPAPGGSTIDGPAPPPAPSKDKDKVPKRDKSIQMEVWIEDESPSSGTNDGTKVKKDTTTVKEDDMDYEMIEKDIETNTDTGKKPSTTGVSSFFSKYFKS